MVRRTTGTSPTTLMVRTLERSGEQAKASVALPVGKAGDGRHQPAYRTWLRHVRVWYISR
jgi:hypothetical protein